MKILCLAGAYGSGKSFLANKLADLLPNTIVLPLAQALRLELLASGKYSQQELFSKPTLPYVRCALQTRGDEQRAKYGETYWSQRWFISANKSNKPNIICDDMRFITDYKEFCRYGETTLFFIGQDDANYDLSKLKVLADKQFTYKPEAKKVLAEWTKLNF